MRFALISKKPYMYKLYEKKKKVIHRCTVLRERERSEANEKVIQHMVWYAVNQTLVFYQRCLFSFPIFFSLICSETFFFFSLTIAHKLHLNFLIYLLHRHLDAKLLSKSVLMAANTDSPMEISCVPVKNKKIIHHQ